jgi:hypothetical protein
LQWVVRATIIHDSSQCNRYFGSGFVSFRAVQHGSWQR